MIMYRLKRFIYECIQNEVRNYLMWADERTRKENEWFIKTEIRHNRRLQKLKIIKRIAIECRKKSNIWFAEECKKYANDIRILRAYETMRAKDNQ